MVKSELINRSPLRIFEKSIHGGVGRGHIGVLASKKGVGKTACLVHIATDKLLRDKKVIHVSFATKVDHIMSWYDDIFSEIAKKRNLEGANEVHDEIIRNRVIMNFSREGVSISQVISSLTALIKDGDFHTESIIFDGIDFPQFKKEDFIRIKEFAEQFEIEIWFSVSLKADKPEYDENGIPKDLENYLDLIDVLIALRFEEEDQFVHLHLVKNRNQIGDKDMQLSLDPKTLLIADPAK